MGLCATLSGGHLLGTSSCVTVAPICRIYCPCSSADKFSRISFCRFHMSFMSKDGFLYYFMLLHK